MKKKVLVTMTFTPDFITGFDSCVEILESNGFEVIVDERAKSLSKEELISSLKGVYAHVASAETYSEDLLNELDGSLKIISRMGVGYDHIDVEAISKRGIALTITPGANAEAVAEHTMALMMALTRKLKEIDTEIRQGIWKSYFGVTMYRKTLGIIGTGNIGKQLAKNVSGFDMRVLAYDLYPNEAFAKENNITYCSMETLLRESDFISVHIPYNPGDAPTIGEKEFAMMKPTAQFFNCARGELVDEKALYKALVEKKIAGAGLDVFEQEPTPSDNPLFTLDNVLMTPHTSGMTFEGRKKVIDMAFQNIVDISEGKKPIGLVNPQIYK